MLKVVNSFGFSLLETMLALFILTATLMTIIPAFIKVQEERYAIRIDRYVEEKMNSYYERVFLHGEQINETFHYESLTFFAWTREEEGHTIFCISWVGRNEREYERCLSTFKEV